MSNDHVNPVIAGILDTFKKSVFTPRRCHACGGAGYVEYGMDDGALGVTQRCTQCAGSGNIIVETPA